MCSSDLHPSEVAAPLQMARLMVESGRSPLPCPPQRLVAVFQPHRYSRTAQFLDGFAQALSQTERVVIAPLYAAGEAPINGVSSGALAKAIQRLSPRCSVGVAADLDDLARQVAAISQEGDLVLAMGAGDVNSLWDRLHRLPAHGDAVPLAA